MIKNEDDKKENLIIAEESNPSSKKHVTFKENPKKKKMIKNKEEIEIVIENSEEDEKEKIKISEINPENKKKMLIYGLLLSSTGIIFGFKVAFYNSFFAQFISEIYKIDDPDKKTTIFSNLAFFFPVGCLIAAVSSFRIYEKIGRYNCFYLLVFLTIMNCVINNIVNIYILYTGRVFEGFISCFWLFICHLMIKEVVWHKIRRMIANSFIVFTMIGANLAFIFANRNNVAYWRWLMFFPLLLDVPKVILFYFFFPMRSPVFLYEKYSKTYQNLNKILTKNYQVFYSLENSKKLTKNFLNSKKNSIQKKRTIKSLLQKEYKKHMYFALFVNLAQQITGITCLVNFSTKIYTIIGVKHPHIYTIIMGISSLLSVILITIIGNKIKKKNPLLNSLLLQTFSWLLIMLSMIFNSTILCGVGSCLFMSFNSIYKSIHLSYVVDFIPSQGLSVASVGKWLINIVFAKFFLYLVDFLGLFYVFVVFFVVSVICSIVFMGFAVCTHGKSDLEIFEEFRDKKFMK